ncbi:Very-short-patch mismatch repair endonuclease (G-T specific) [hydrothermal vent metagenome]|uniref:Very-short-patch mismatch repair endonuclease (G-T specific) n=1 Tax=hydrothermal vent metagenome TaxID=652676 RepID=A0A3B1C9D0_9ZZZZ
MRRNVKHVSKSMRAVKAADTSPEIALRKALWAKGLRYRLHVAKLPGKPDIVFSLAKVAVFVDGDYWHGNQWRLRGFKSLEEQLAEVHNRTYWEKKIKGNMERDKKNNALLRKAGWKVVRVWESDIKRRPATAVERIVKAVESRIIKS